MANCALEGCRLGLAQGDKRLAEARRLIEKMGYHSRDGEVAELKAMVWPEREESCE